MSLLQKMQKLYVKNVWGKNFKAFKQFYGIQLERDMIVNVSYFGGLVF